MSHFTVLVIGPDHEKQLAPFQENNMGDCPSEYLQFFDTEDENRQEYETKSVEKVVMPDGTLKNTWDKSFEVKGKSLFDTRKVIPDYLKRREVPFKELYKTFEEYMADWHDAEERDPKMKRYGYWENAKAKWDWYQVGGRYRGFFKLKKGFDGKVGEPGIFDNQAEPGHVDQCMKGAVDFDGMRDDAGKEAGEIWDKVHAALRDTPILHWDKVREEIQDIELARSTYNNSEAQQKIRKAKLDVWRLEGFDVPRDVYVKQARDGAFATFAVLKDGKWYERGEMGWWAVVHNEKDKEVWLEEVNKLLDSLSDDTLLTVIDAHI